MLLGPCTCSHLELIIAVLHHPSTSCSSARSRSFSLQFWLHPHHLLPSPRFKSLYLTPPPQLCKHPPVLQLIIPSLVGLTWPSGWRRSLISSVYLLLHSLLSPKGKRQAILQEKIPKLIKTLSWWLSSNFVIFSRKMSVTFESNEDILCLKT